MPLLMLLPMLGGALFLRRILALNDSGSLLISVSSILLLTYLSGLLGMLQAGVFLICGLGILLLVWELRFYFLSQKFFFSYPYLLFLVLPILYWLVHADSKPMFWDEYSHWGIYIREMAATHTFYTVDTNASHPDYPPGAAVWQYFFTLIPGYGEGTVYLAQFVLLMTPLLVLFENLKFHHGMWVLALLSFCVLGLANFGHGIVSLYTDHQLSVLYTGVILQALLRSQKKMIEMGLMSLPLAVILLIKDAGLPLAASAAFLIISLMVFRYYQQHKNLWFQRKFLLTVLILISVPLAFQLSWKVNRNSHGIESKQEGTGLLRVLLSGETKFSEIEMQTYRDHFWEALSRQQLSRDENSLKFNEFGYRLMPLFQDSFRLTLLGMLLIFPLWALLIIYWSENTRRFEYAMVLGVLYFTALAYLFIMYRTYPLIHTVERAQNLVSFLRYAHTISLPLFLIGLALFAPPFQTSKTNNIKSFFKNFKTITFGIALLLLFVFETPIIKPFYTTASFENYPGFTASKWRKDTDDITQKIKETIGNANLWIYLPIQDNGFFSTALRYQMTPVRTVVNRDPEFLKKPGKELGMIWDDHDYLWFPIINPETEAFFKKRFTNIKSRLLKVTKNDTHISITGVAIKPSS